VSEALIATNEGVRLAELEATIERGLQTFVDVGNALLEIRDGRLYRQTHGTFEDYCRERWGFTDRRARMLMSAAETVGVLETGTTVPVLPSTERQARPLTALPPDAQREAWQRAVETAPDGKMTAAHVQRVVDEQRHPTLRPSMAVHYSSETPEWLTPSDFLSLVYAMLGHLDLDPCSSSRTDPNVCASAHYTAEDDGLSQEWHGQVFMNPPYGRELADWITKLVAEYRAGHVTEAIALVPSRTDTAWFRELRDFPRCFINGRMRFSGYETAAPFPSMAVYLGDDPVTFSNIFSTIGDVFELVR